MKSSKAQIWVETVIYTLIGLVIIGIVLAIVTPAIGKYKDRTIIEQTISSLNMLNDKILETRETAGNVRVVEFRIKKGELIINGSADKITYILEESGFEYSQAGEEVEQGDIKIFTEEKGRKYNIMLSLEYPDLNITYVGEDKKKILQEAPIPYKLSIKNIDDPSTADIIEIDLYG